MAAGASLCGVLSGGWESGSTKPASVTALLNASSCPKCCPSVAER